MARKLPTVWVIAWGAHRGADVQLPAQTEGAIRLDSPRWGAWLAAPSTRSFAYPVYAAQGGYIRGFMTVRKETRRRGGQYWVAYHRAGRRVRKIYLGDATQLSEQHVAATAERFLEMERVAAPGALETDS